MSRRGRGRQSDIRSNQPSPASSSSHQGGGRGRGGRGRGAPSPAAAFPAWPPTEADFPAAPAPAALSPSSFSASSSSAPPSTLMSLTALSSEMEGRLKLQTPAHTDRAAPPTSSKALCPPKRPGYGTIGQKVFVRANHFLVEVADRDLYRYDVSITPEVTSKKIDRDVMIQLIESYGDSHLGRRKPAFDGWKSLYTAGPLPFESKKFAVNLINNDGRGASSKSARREGLFIVEIKLASKADLHNLREFLCGKQLDSPQETIQLLGVVLRETPSQNYTSVGRSFFHPKLGPGGELGDGLEYWRGYYQGLRPTQMGLSLNIDVSTRAFCEPIIVTEFVAKHLNFSFSKELSDQDRLKIKKALRGLEIEVTHRKHFGHYRVVGVSTQPTSQIMFTLEGKKTRMSVVQYFREKYDIVLQHSSLPALQAQNDAKPVYLPMELCKIVDGQRYSKRLNERQVINLLRATCQRPKERESSIEQVVTQNNFNRTELVKEEFGIEVRDKFAVVDARVLPPPMLKYHDTGRESREVPKMGRWNMINKKMINGGRVDCWTCLNLSAQVNRDLPFEFCHQLINMCNSKGMVFYPDPLIPISSAHSGQIEKALYGIHKELAGKQLQLLIIILPDISGSYGKIKRICETELGIVSQCCQPRQASRLNKQYLENVALKINVKVGGRNTVLEDAIQRKIHFLTDRPTIVFGASVTHPQPGEDSSPSIAAVVASTDWPEVTRYRGLFAAQAHREEIIQDLYKLDQDPQRGPVHGGMIRELLQAFRISTGVRPERIIFYRDGVCEGQFSQVLLYEMDAIRKACLSLESGYLPPVTFVVVQKRHHTRLFPADHNRRDQTDKSGNILPGTVVDTKICHPTEFDFYLNSHAGIQGTSRPTHYHVLYDENGFSADALQVLTNNLCYTYARCTRSVSIVPPVYYAHLAAFRARYYTEGDSSESGSTGGNESKREFRALPLVKENVKNVMFYC